MSGARQTRKSRPAQRWPDIMVGAITLALLAGFGTLVFGDRHRPLTTQVAPIQPTTPVIPASPGTVPEPQAATPPTVTPPSTVASASDSPSTASTSAATTAGSQASTTNGTPPASGTASPATPQAATSQALDPASVATAPTSSTTNPASTQPTVAQTSEIPPVPKAPAVAPIKPPVLPETPASAQQTGNTSPTTPATAQETGQAASGAVQARAGGAVATSENRVPLRSDYRISLGSFSTRKTVESQTANVRGLGYTIHAIDLGDQYVAQIGPFANEDEARRALSDIQRAYPGALLYRPRNAPSDSTQASNTENGGNDPTPTATTTETTPARPQAAAPGGPTYIQVGAFDREESAQKLVGILSDNGFNATVNSPEGRKTTVMVGPYSGDAVLRAEARLDNAGLDHFRVR